MPVLNPQGLIDERAKAIKDFHVQIGQKRAEIDLSGGVDSAVVLALLVKALKPENVTAVWQGIKSSPDALKRAQAAAFVFGVRLVESDWSPMMVNLQTAMVQALSDAGYDRQEVFARLDADPTILGSLRSCLRAPIGRGFNRMMGGGIRHGTGNEDEDRWMRFYQKGGDGEVDTNPIAFLSKGEVWQLALALGVPKSILEARPSPDLWGTGDAHNDEDEIKTYLGLPKDCPYPMYSYVNFETGQYKNVGLIERVSRFDDVRHFLSVCDDEIAMGRNFLGYPMFQGIPIEVVKRLCHAARRVEKMTRHKANPNIPMLGNRADLVDDGILTDDLPVGD